MTAVLITRLAGMAYLLHKLFQMVQFSTLCPVSVCLILKSRIFAACRRISNAWRFSSPCRQSQGEIYSPLCPTFEVERLIFKCSQ